MAVIFGGGTMWSDGRVHNDVHTLNLTSWEWELQDVTGQPPPPRQGHSAFTTTSGNILMTSICPYCY